jgi:hypothetical protein
VTPPIRVFVNERPVEVPAGSTAREAVAALDWDLAAALEESGTYLTDGVGRRIAPDTALAAGAILRVVRSARRTDAGGGET